MAPGTLTLTMFRLLQEIFPTELLAPRPRGYLALTAGPCLSNKYLYV